MAYKKPIYRVQMDDREVRKALHALVPPGELFEIRIIDEGWISSGYFTDVELAIQELKKTLITENAGVYITLNHIKSACGSRKQRDKFKENAKPTTSDKDIDHYQYLMIDFDPERVSGVSSSDAELREAHSVAESVVDFLRGKGWPEPLQGLSGNGYHALYWIENLAASDKRDDPNTILIKKVLEALNQQFGTARCKVDEVNFNPARVCKLYGTMAQKGENTPDRPHRLSKLINIPEDISQVTRQQLEDVAALWMDPKGSGSKSETIKTKTGELKIHTTGKRNSYGIDDLGTWLDEHGIEHAAPVEYEGGLKYILKQCVFRQEHTGTEAAVFVTADGTYGYRCQHDSCKDYHFKDFVQKVDPDRIAQYAAANHNEKKSIVLTIGGYDDVEIKPIDYLFYPWFPRGKLTAVQGDSSSSKSTFMYAVGAKVSTGEDLLGVPCEDPGNVMFVTIEDDASDIKIAFTDAGGSVSNLRRITDREQIASLDLSPEGAAAIDTIIKQENIKLLVLDPLQQFLTGDMNKANETRPQLGRLMNIAAENNICIAFLEHMGKDTSKAALHRGVGSVDIGASTRSIIQIVTDPEDDCYKIAFTVKNNTADFHETQRAIRYQVKDHPGRNTIQGANKREHYHGHAEFIGILPEYNERLYKKAVRKADDTAEEEILLTFEYDKDPLVKTIREIVAENPQRVFIGTDDLIQKITTVCGHCPYDQSSNKITGIYARVDKLRSMMIDNDGIQVDKQGNPMSPKAYNWRGELHHPEDTRRTRGFHLTAVKAKNPGSQQTKI